MKAQLLALDPPARQQLLAELSPGAAATLLADWRGLWARPEQLEPGTDGAVPLPVVDGQLQRWRSWLVLAGRGFGKTRTGAEWVRDEVEAGRAKRIALVAATAADARDTMVEGESGILATASPGFRPRYEPSKRRITWPNGAVATCFAAEAPGRLRGPQHDLAWADELAVWPYPQETWDNLQLGLRLGHWPRCCITTTPRPTPLIRQLLKDTGKADGTVLTRGSTYANVGNLAPAFLAFILGKYEGTRLGRQELHAEVLEDHPGALWKRALIDELRVGLGGVPQLQRVAIGVDPAAGVNPRNSETGIVAAGVGECWCKGKAELHAFILEDLSGHHTPGEWGQLVVGSYARVKADRVVAEVNQGGALVEANLRGQGPAGQAISYRAVHASRGKFTRAEPVAALYEQRKVHHVGQLPQLEDQQCQWAPAEAPADSPDRVDALTWVLTDLMLGWTGPDYTGPTAALPRRRI